MHTYIDTHIHTNTTHAYIHTQIHTNTHTNTHKHTKMPRRSHAHTQHTHTHTAHTHTHTEYPTETTPIRVEAARRIQREKDTKEDRQGGRTQRNRETKKIALKQIFQRQR